MKRQPRKHKGKAKPKPQPDRKPLRRYFTLHSKPGSRITGWESIKQTAEGEIPDV